MLSSRALRAGPSGRASAAKRLAPARAFGAGEGADAGQGSGRAFLDAIFARFGPQQDRATNLTTLDFEKPLLELDKRIREVRKVAEENGVDVSQSIAELETRAQQHGTPLNACDLLASAKGFQIHFA